MATEKPSKLRAEWFWTDRWFGSSAIELAIEPRGLYREMLTRAWPRGARLPNNHEAIRRMTGCTVVEWRRCWPKVEPYWRVDGESLVNDTQLEIYAEAVKLFEGNSERGKKGANARWHKPEQTSGNAQASSEHMPEHEPMEWHQSPSLEVPPQKPAGGPRARGRSHGLIDPPVNHGDCIAHGPICLRPRVAERLNLLVFFKGDGAALKSWAKKICERWTVRVESGAQMYTADEFEFWRREYGRDFGANQPKNDSRQDVGGRCVPGVDATAALLAEHRKAAGR